MCDPKQIGGLLIAECLLVLILFSMAVLPSQNRIATTDVQIEEDHSGTFSDEVSTETINSLKGFQRDILKRFEGYWEVEKWVASRNCENANFREFAERVNMKIFYSHPYVEVVTKTLDEQYYKDDAELTNIFTKRCIVESLSFVSLPTLLDVTNPNFGSCGGDEGKVPYKHNYIFLNLVVSSNDGEETNNDCGSLALSYDDEGLSTVVRGPYSGAKLSDDGIATDVGLFVDEGWLMRRTVENPSDKSGGLLDD
jgi:hypothetical protein